MEANDLLLREDILNCLGSRFVLFFDDPEDDHFVDEVSVLSEGRLCLYQTIPLSSIPEEDDFELDPRLASLFLSVGPCRCYPGHLSAVLSEGQSLVFVSVRPCLCLAH